MATRARITRYVAEIAERHGPVTFEEVDRIVNQIRLLGEMPVSERKTTHGYQYTIGPCIFSVNPNYAGPLKKCYVRDFLDAMIELGFYEE